MLFREHADAVEAELGYHRSGYHLGDEWIPRYKRIRDVAAYSGETMDAARIAGRGGFVDAQTVLQALVRGLRLVDACREIGAEVNYQWPMSTVQRSYHFRAASLVIDACLPFDDQQRDVIRSSAEIALSPEPVTVYPAARPVVQRGEAWLAGIDPDQPEFGNESVDVALAGSCYYFERAQASLWTLSMRALWDTDADVEDRLNRDYEQ